ncbi:MAG: hypothetical protein ABJB85_02540 [Nitrososphaerota archaeon]
MPSQSDQSFFSKQNFELRYRLGCLVTVFDIVLEIKYTRMRNDFYHYLSWRIQSVNLEKKVVHKHKNFVYSVFIEESWKAIEKFVKFAVEIYNESHPMQRTTTDHAIRTLKEWWDYDYEEYLSDSIMVE